MQRKCKVCDGWHDLDEPWPETCLWEQRARQAKRYGAVPYVISDEMRAMKHHGTGEIIDSKAKFRQATRAAGCVEIGNEPIKSRPKIQLDRGKRRDDIRRVIYEIRNGR